MTVELKPCHQVEILTLQDNLIDLVSRDDSEILKRARLKPRQGKDSSLLAEHGFCALVTVTVEGMARSLLFDFGFSADGAARNAEILEADLTRVEVMALSHGHLDHTGGLIRLAELTGRKGIELVAHPAAFRSPRYRKIPPDIRIDFPPFTRDQVRAAGCVLVETLNPKLLLDGLALFLGEIPRKTEFERGDTGRFYEEAGEEKVDRVDDDTAVVFKLKEKGLVVLSGCAHAGIINTVRHAQSMTGTSRVHAVIGGFHLPTPTFDHVVGPTIEAFIELDPDFIIPTHCTGRKAALQIEQSLPDKFLLNMAGTRIVFQPDHQIRKEK